MTGRSRHAGEKAARQTNPFCTTQLLVAEVVAVAERRFAFRLRLRSVTNYYRDLPPGGHSRQAEEFSALADYRAAPAT